jgi:hypothetical protein
MRVMFLPVLRCRAKWCNASFVGTGDHCLRCTGKRASRRDVIEHKRLSLRKRLGLPA